ncbi:MAG: ABC transporter permease [Terracidiphilus sp.]|nr:ABC transporter permease [Terracidiphilus sp.]
MMLAQDLRFAVRQLRRAPGFAITVALTLALSVGVAAAVFSVIDAVILRPLPYAQPDRIVSVMSQSRSGYQQPASWPSFKDEREQVHVFTALAAYNDFGKMTLQTPASGPMLVDSVHATDNFFQVFAVQPVLGRTFLPGEEVEGRNQVAVLSYELWQQYFGGSSDVLGRGVTLDGMTYTVIGVMPAGFRFPLSMRNGVYTPMRLNQEWMLKRGNHWLRTVGRLRDGVSLQQGQADLTQVFANIAKANPETDEGRTVRVRLLSDSITSQTHGPLWTLLGAVLAVLAIGCVNVAGLLLARGVKREREMAMRTAIGASRLRMMRQVLTEGVVLALLGGAGGMVLAWGLLDVMRAFLVKALSRGADVHLNWTVLGAAIAVSILASLAASLYPALKMSSIEPQRALKAGGSAGSARGQHRLRAGFIITQVALTMVLLLVAGLLMRVVTKYRNADLGFDAAHILAVDLNPSPARYAKNDILLNFYQPLLDRVQKLPGVRAAGVISILPIENWGSNSDIHIAGQPPTPPNLEVLSEVRMVSTGYYEVFGIPLRRGRALSAALERPDATAASVVVNEAFVKKFIPNGIDPTAQRIDDNDKPEAKTRIVGVVGNVRQDIYQAPMAEHDYLIDQVPVKMRADQLSGMTMVVRFDGNAAALVPGLRAALHEVDPTVPFHEARTMTDVVAETLVFERMESWLFGIFAGLALLLALVGLYGLISHEVELGTRDIGVRMALGASRGRILAAVLTRVSWMLATGTAAGLVLAWGTRKLIGVVIYLDFGKQGTEMLLVATGLMLAGLVAALLPARRAATVDPMRALRTE